METKDDLMDVLEYYMDNKSNFTQMNAKDILELIDLTLDYQKSTIEPQLDNTPIILLKQQTKMLEDVLTTLNPEVYSYTLQTITNILKQGYYEVGDKQQLNEIRDMYQTKITNG
jgi:hypothetical protein